MGMTKQEKMSEQAHEAAQKAAQHKAVVRPDNAHGPSHLKPPNPSSDTPTSRPSTVTCPKTTFTQIDPHGFQVANRVLQALAHSPAPQ